MAIATPLLRAVEAGRASLSGVLRGLEAEAEAEAKRIAEKLSSGPYSTAVLRAMGHPYARRRPRPPQDPAIINVQSGRFRSSWNIRARIQGFRMTLELENTAPYARYLLHGTSLMIERPYEKRLREEMSRALPRILSRALLGRSR